MLRASAGYEAAQGRGASRSEERATNTTGDERSRRLTAPRRRATSTARVVAGRAPQTLTVVRERAQPAAVMIARLASTGAFAYLVALLLPGGSYRPVLAPLTALLVAQASLYQTVHSAARRVASVVAGVLVAPGQPT